MRSLLLALLLLVLSPLVVAAPAPKPISLAELSPTELSQRVEKLKDNAPKFASKSAERQFHSDIEALTSRLVGRSDFAEFSENEQVRIVSAYESLRAIADAGDAKANRRICERVQRTGSHRVTTICLTQAERDRNKEVAQDSMIDIQRKSPSSAAR